MTDEQAAPRARIMGRGGVALTAVLVAGALVIGLVVAPGGAGGLALRSDSSSNLSLLVPVGWRSEDLVAPYGTALSGWFDTSDTHASETVRATLPAALTPRQRAQDLAARLHGRSAYVESYLGSVTLAGGRPAYVLEYTLDGYPMAVFEFDACHPAIAVTVTLSASSPGKLSAEQLALAQGAEPICDGPAFTSPDRADLAVPLTLPS